MKHNGILYELRKQQLLQTSSEKLLVALVTGFYRVKQAALAASSVCFGLMNVGKLLLSDE